MALPPAAVTWELAILNDIDWNFGPPAHSIGFYFNDFNPVTADATLYGGYRCYYDRNGKQIDKVEHHDLILESNGYIHRLYMPNEE